jgi:TetR/AcrR family transcriptional regulator, repressor for uid operon
MPRISEAERAHRRDRLVDAAWRCLARSSYSELTVDDVCAEASVSKGGFYGHFESKQDLLHELLLRESTSLDAVIASLSDAPIGAAERLRRFARACLNDAKDSARMQIRADLASAVGGDPAIESALREIARHRRAALRTWIEEGVASNELRVVPANALASILLALADGLAVHHRRDPTAFRWQNVRLALDALISGIEAG